MIPLDFTDDEVFEAAAIEEAYQAVVKRCDTLLAVTELYQKRGVTRDRAVLSLGLAIRGAARGDIRASLRCARTHLKPADYAKLRSSLLAELDEPTERTGTGN